MWLVALTAAVAGLDQLTKLAVVSTLGEGESRPIFDNILRLSHVRNSGAAFGILKGFSGVLALAALVGVIAFVAIVVQRPAPLNGIAAALVAGGALGNLIDRATRGTVVDFVDFRYWPSFNVADSAISVGALLLIWVGLSERTKRAEAP